jgi:signal transduction histidine kinase
MKIDPVRHSPSELAKEVVEAQSPLAASSGIELRLEMAREPRECMGDRNRLQRVLENLIGNALKFCKEGGHITVGVDTKERDVVFSVSDSGPGMAPEVTAHVFDRFWQATARASRLGAGLGLPIARGIVEAHGGRMWVESALGEGTTFYFTIPAAPTELSLPPRPSRQRGDRSSSASRAARD